MQSRLEIRTTSRARQEIRSAHFEREGLSVHGPHGARLKAPRTATKCGESPSLHQLRTSNGCEYAFTSHVPSRLTLVPPPDLADTRPIVRAPPVCLSPSLRPSGVVFDARATRPPWRLLRPNSSF